MLRNLLRIPWGPSSGRAPRVNLLAKRDAGHSKWANIRHIKALKDGQKSIMFTKLGRQIRLAVQEGGSSDPGKNLKLEQIIAQAKRMNMPVASIQSIIKSSQTDKSKCKQHLLEIKGPGGSLILCEVFTENLQHTKARLTSILRKHLCKYSDGGGKHLFELKGLIDTELPKAAAGGDVLELATEHAIESGAEDVTPLDDAYLQFVCSDSTFDKVQRRLFELNYVIVSASVEYVPLKVQELNEEELKVCSSLYEKLEGHPEVVKLYDNIA